MNKRTRIPALAFAALLAASAVLAFAPTAEAQVQQCSAAAQATVTPTITPPAGRIKPITDTAVLSAKVTYVASEQSTSITPVKVDIDARAEDPSWAVVTVSPTVDYVTLENNAQTNKPIDVKITVALTKDAPAFAQQNIILTAKAAEGTCVGAAAEVETKALIKADFYERTQARFEKTIHKAGQNSQVSIPLTIENFGNGAINVQFFQNEATNKDLVLALPGLQIVPSTIAGGETNRLPVSIDVKTPFKNGYENRQDALVLDIRGTSADDSTVAINDLQVSAVIQTQGVYVPGFEAVTMLTALLGAVFASRRFRA